MNIKQRKKTFDKFSDNFDFTRLQKNKVLGEGGQGKVYSYCENNAKTKSLNDNCIAVKKIYIESQQSKYLTDPFSKRALKHSTFIELAAMKLINEIVLAKICPNFLLNYSWKSKSRTGICDDIYPNVIYFFNEYLANSQTFTQWVKDPSITQEHLYNAYFQIIYAIYTLQLRLNMTHLDLHADNIIVQKITSGGYWEYTIGQDTYYIPNLGYIFYINDFGHAWIPNVLRSWFIRERYKPKNIKRHFDLMTVYRSYIKTTIFPKLFQKILQSIIKNLRENTDVPFNEIIKQYFYNKYGSIQLKSKIIEKYNINNPINLSQIPKEFQLLL